MVATARIPANVQAPPRRARPRIAIIGSRGYPSSYGGFETFVRHFAPHLRDAGVEVSVYCRGRERRTREEVVDGVRCVWTPGVNRKALSTLSYGLTASIDSVTHRPDAALVLNVANGYYLPMLRRAGIPTAVNVDGMEWERAKWNAAGKALFRWGASLTARYADEIVVDSKAIGDVWRSMFGVESNFIPYGAPVVRDHGSARVDQLGLRPGRYVLVVARLVPENNVEILLEALSLLGGDVPAVIVGSAPVPTDLERELARRSVSSPDFHWLGHVSDQALLTELWRNCGVYFHGHSVGGTNPALLQALGCGSPTVAIDTPFNREVIDHADHLCPAGAGAVALKVGAVLGDPVLRTRMAERGREIVADRYQWDDVCRSYTDLLLRLAGAPADRRGPLMSSLPRATALSRASPPRRAGTARLSVSRADNHSAPSTRPPATSVNQ